MENSDSKVTDSKKSLVLYHGACHEICQIFPTDQHNQILAKKKKNLQNIVIYMYLCIIFEKPV